MIHKRVKRRVLVALRLTLGTAVLVLLSVPALWSCNDPLIADDDDNDDWDNDDDNDDNDADDDDNDSDDDDDDNDDDADDDDDIYQECIDVTLYGDQRNSYLGYSVTMGDFNDDGLDDMAVSAPSYTNGAANDSGQIWLLWGGDDADRDLVIRPADYDPILGYYHLGMDLAVGDVNGDGVDDLLASAPNAMNPDSMIGDAGAIFVFYGRTNWPAESVLDPYADPALLADVQVFGMGYMYFGTKIASGDLNDDGYDDIIGSEPSSGPGGYVMVVYGGNYPSGTIFTLYGDADLEIHGPDYGAPHIGMGNGLASGDVNGDNIDDLLMGAPGTWNEYVKIGLDGSVHILFGRTGWTEAAPIDLDVTSENVLISGVNEYANLGFAVTVGDVNGDGFGDIVMGAPNVSIPPSKTDYDGTVYVVYGQDFPPNADIDLNGIANRDITIHGRIDLNFRFGFSIATGDINGDGIDDMLIGEYYSDNTFLLAYAVYGSDDFPANHVMQMPGDATHQLSGETDLDLFGFSVALGDTNGDMADDMLIGAKSYDVAAKDISQAGAMYLLCSPK